MPLIMPAEKLETLYAIVESLRSVPNIVAVALGGSYARGLARPDSDIDIGIYYRDALPFPVDNVRLIAEKICRPGTIPTVKEVCC